MNQLPYPLEYMHKFNVHKWLGLVVSDDDITSIARMYGVRRAQLRRIERSLRENVARLASLLPEKRPAHSPLTILALGDSISSDRESYVQILNQYWRGTSQKMIDCAVSGDTTCDLLDRLYVTALSQEFDWVVIFIGTNDCRQLDDDAHLSLISLQEYQRNLEYLTDLCVSRGKQVVLVTLPPVDNKRFSEFFPDTRRQYDKNRLDATNRWLRELASRKGLPAADLAAAIAAQSEDVLTPDGLHLNDTGQLMLSRLLLDLIP